MTLNKGLNKEDQEFLEGVSRSLEPLRAAPWDSEAVKAKYKELCPVMDELFEEMLGFAGSSMKELCPSLPASKIVVTEVLLLAKMMFAHGFVRAWQTKDYNDKGLQ